MTISRPNLYSPAESHSLPQGFVDLTEILPEIIMSPRYFMEHNFVGKQIRGYTRPAVVCAEGLAIQLKCVHQELLKEGYNIVVYDSYRPQQAVDHFYEWSLDSNDQLMKAEYYPRVNKEDAFQLGYIAKKSQHTRGAAIDLTIIEKGKDLHPVQSHKRYLEDGFEILFLDDGTEDMGTSFDLFDDASHHNSPLIHPQYTQKRNFLSEVMVKHGFQPYSKEWWHYSLKEEPFPDTYFDFSI